MSVYTPINKDELIEFLQRFSCGTLREFKGIEGGIENTNYFVTTSTGEYVLTIFESITESSLHAVLLLAHHLGQQGLQVPTPESDNTGKLLQHLKNKPAVLCPRLAGKHIEKPNVEHCFAIGQALAEFHLKSQTLSPRNPNLFHLAWWQSQGPKLVAALPSQKQQIFQHEIQFQTAHHQLWKSLPRGWVHADLFHDNALFDGEKFSILDLYAACEEAWIYDLAVLANDWCCDQSGHWYEGCVEALFAGYQRHRPLQDKELAAWNLALRAGALRWWLGRLDAQEFQANKTVGVVLKKDPDEYLNKLIKRRADSVELVG